MKNGNCINCPHLHRCCATTNDECIDTILKKKHFMSDREKQIRADVIDEFVRALEKASGEADWECIDKHWILPIAEQLKERQK